MEPTTVTAGTDAPGNGGQPKTTQLASLVKAYDVRGVVGEELTGEAAFALGWAFARLVTSRASLPEDPEGSTPLPAPLDRRSYLS